MLRAALLLFALSAASAQTAQPAFEVASVKRSAAGEPTDILDTTFDAWMRGGPGTSDPGQISFKNAALRSVILSAYGVKRYQVSGPEWLAAACFDILAKVPAGASKEEVKVMLQNLLAERFHLTLHREQREIPVYALVVAKNGPKMKLARKTDEGGMWNAWNGNARWMTHNTTMQNLVDFLSPRLDRPVLDKTGLTEHYDFTLTWTAENLNPRLRKAPTENAGEDAAEPAPTIFGAVQQQLGLKLEQSKSTMAILVIDHAEKTPTEN